MSRIADEVAKTYLEWIQTTADRHKTTLDTGLAGCIIRDLDGVSSALQTEIVNDIALPAAVRVGALLLPRGEIDSAFAPLVDRAIREIVSDAHPSRTYPFVLVEEALWRLPPATAETMWRQLVEDEQVLPRWRALVLAGVASFRSDSDSLQLVEGLDERASLYVDLEIMKAWLGRRESMLSLTAAVAQLDEYGLRGWARLVSRYRERELVVKGLDLLFAQDLTVYETHEFVHILWSPLTHDISSRDPLGIWSGRYRRLHPAADHASELFRRLAPRLDDRNGARVLCLMVAVDLGNEEARKELMIEFSRPRRGTLSWKEDYALGHAVSVLSRRGLPPLNVIEAFERPPNSNLSQSIYRACGRQPSREGLEFLLREYRRVQGHSRDSVLAALRLVSIGLGVRIESRSGELVEASPS